MGLTLPQHNPKRSLAYKTVSGKNSCFPSLLYVPMYLVEGVWEEKRVVCQQKRATIKLLLPIPAISIMTYVRQLLP